MIHYSTVKYQSIVTLVCHNMLMVGEEVVVVVSHVHCVSAKTRLISVRQSGESEQSTAGDSLHCS